MIFRFIWIGKTSDPLYFQIEERYLKRVQRYFRATRTTVRELKKSDRRQQATQLQREAQKIKSKLSAGDYLIALDEGGREFKSLELASLLQDLVNQGVTGITFVVGGYLGIPNRIKELADLTMSLTKLTLPHELCRVVLLEQVYRAVSIVKGFPYPK